MRSHRSGLLLCVGVAVALAGCGSSSTGSSDTIATLSGTNFVVEPTVPASTTTTVPPVAGDPIAGQTMYTVQAGDLPYTIANKYKVGLSDLIKLNGWTLQGQYVTDFPSAGTQIKIPAGATVPGASAPTSAPPAGATPSTTQGTPTESSAPGSSAPGQSSATTSTVAGGADNCKAGSYTITKDDTTRIKVASKFNVTVAQLDAANTGTSGYSAFYPGLKIVIPAKSSC